MLFSLTLSLGYGGQPVTLLYRTSHWVIAHHYFYGVPMSYLTSRFLQLLVQQPIGGRTVHTVISAFLSPLVSLEFLFPTSIDCVNIIFINLCLLLTSTLAQRWALSKALECYLLYTLPLVEYGFVSDKNIIEEFKSCELTLLPDRFFDRVKEGHVKLKKTASNWSFTSNGVILPTGDTVEADVIVLCTGYEGEKKIKSLLGMGFKDLLQEDDGSIPLYR